MLERILGSMSFVVAVFFGAMITAYKSPRKKYFIVRMAVLCLLLCVIRYGLDQLITQIWQGRRMNFEWNIFLRATNCLLIMVLSCASVCVCYKCSVWVGLFCGSIGYCMQYIARKIYEFFITIFEYSPDKYIETLFVLIISVVVYFAIWWMGIRKLKKMEVIDNNKQLIVIVLLVAILTIYLNSYINYTWDKQKLKLYIHLLSILAAIVTLVMGIIFFLKKSAEKEISALKQFLHQEREQYRIEKTVIDTINIKCHDLKHQLMALNGILPSSELSELEKAVDVYDSVFETESHALNVVLTTKGLLCENKGITFTCIADGGLLSFMSDTDIYSLFGNILDNAIEASDKIEVKEKRLISMTIQQQQCCVVIHAENYFAETPLMVNGVPQTSKTNTKYHGFGIPSIKMLVEKYKGSLKIAVKEEVYELDIVFPLDK